MLEEKRTGILKLGVAVLAAWGISAGQADAASFTLTDDNSTVRFDTESSVFLSDWVVDGFREVFQRGFWYRVGDDGPERNVHSTLTQTQANTADLDSDGRSDELFVEYENPGLFSIEFVYSLKGGSPGSLRSLLNEAVEVFNVSDSPLDISLFAYSDYDLHSSSGGDFVEVSRNPVIGTVAALQQDSTGASVTVASIPGADRYQASNYPDLVAQLNDVSPTNLAFTDGSSTASGDVTFAFQYDRTIGAGESRLISQSAFVQEVPEPTSVLGMLALSVWGGGALLKRRQKQEVNF